MPLRMLDLFCGRFGWGRAFAARGWEVVGVDLVEPPEIPEGCSFRREDVLNFQPHHLCGIYQRFDFICASSPCEQFSMHGMKHFHPNPPYPELGIKLFNHTRALCEAAGVPYVMENVRAAQQFVGKSVNNCGPFHLWGTAVPSVLPQGITKSKWKPREGRPGNWSPMFMGTKSVRKALAATIPIELASCVAAYAEVVLKAPK